MKHGRIEGETRGRADQGRKEPSSQGRMMEVKIMDIEVKSDYVTEYLCRQSLRQVRLGRRMILKDPGYREWK